PGLGSTAKTTAIALRRSLRHVSSLDVSVRAKLSGTTDEGANHCSHMTQAHSALAVAVEASTESAAITEARRSRVIAGPPWLLPASRRTDRARAAQNRIGLQR